MLADQQLPLNLTPSGQEAWPSGVYLALRHGDSMRGPSFLSLPPLKAGEVGDISVNLRSPTAPGLFQSQWKMYSPNGSPCGGMCVCLSVCVSVS